MVTRRKMIQGAAGAAGVAALGPMRRVWAQEQQLNILCWEGYNSDDVLGPFRSAHPEAKVRAQTGTSDPAMINQLRAGGLKVWDVLNVNQPWAQSVLHPEGLITPLSRERFEPYFDLMLPPFQKYPLAYSQTGEELLGMPQRFGPFSFVVNTDKISREMAEDQGWNLFLDEKMKGRYGVLAYDNWNLMHISLTAGLNPFEKMDDAAKAKFEETAKAIVSNAKMLSGDLAAMNLALINGSIDAYFTGGTYTASPARYEGFTNVRAITPNSGPVDGKGGVVWVELTSRVNNPNPSPLGAEFLEFVQQPGICKHVAFAQGTYNPVTQMGNPNVFDRFSKEELTAIQWDSLAEEIERSLDYRIVASYDELIQIYSAAKRA